MNGEVRCGKTIWTGLERLTYRVHLANRSCRTSACLKLQGYRMVLRPFLRI